MADNLEFTGERFIPVPDLLNDEIGFEHLHRYHCVLDLVKDKIVLDLACGEGYGTALMAPKAKKVYGIDIDKTVVDYAEKTYSEAAGNIEFIKGKAQNIPLPDHCVDIVISFETIEHLGEKEQRDFLKEVQRVLNTDGYFIVSTPDKENYSDRYGFTNEFHLKEFKKKEFISFLKSFFKHTEVFVQGYEIISAITKDELKAVSTVKVCDWDRQSDKPFSRKYLIAVCSDKEIEKNLDLSSVVFQVNKDFLQVTDRITEMEKHILELGAWGKNLDAEILEKNKLIRELQIRLEGEALHSFVREQLETIKTKLAEALHYQALFQQQQEELLTKEKETFALENSNKALKEELYLLAERLVTEKENSRKKNEDHQNVLMDNRTLLDEQNHKINLLYRDLDVVKGKLKEIYDSNGWKLLKKYYSMKGGLIRKSSKSYKGLKKIVNKIRGKKDYASKPASLNSFVLQNKELETPEDINNAQQVESYGMIEFPEYESPEVSIIIPVYNGWDITYKCLQSIREYTLGISYKIILADDCSTDQTINASQYAANIGFIRNENNLGFLNNCNNAAATATGEFLLFLNNDTIVRPGWLSALVDLMKSDAAIGMVGSKLIYPDGRLQEAGGIIWNDASGWNFGNGLNPELPEFNYVKEVDYISGAAIMIRTSLWKELGGFDTAYSPAYCEDSDLAFRVREKGFKVMYQPLSEVIHYEGYSHGSDNEKSDISSVKEYQRINNIKFFEKWKPVLQQDQFPNAANVFRARDRSRKKRIILVVDHYVPHYDQDAGSKTIFQYLKLFVSLGFNVKFIGDNFYRHEPYTTKLQQMGIEVLYGSWYADNWQKWIADNGDQFDLVLLSRPHITIKYIDFIRENTRAKILYYGHDLHFVRELKQYEIEKDPALLESSKKWKETEISIYRKSDIILTPSDNEKNIIQELIPGINVHAIRPYLFEKSSQPITNFSERKHILFVGGFSHKPNVDAILWFVKQVWPIVIKQNGGLRFIIAGSNPPEVIMNLADNRIIVKGYISDRELENLYNSVKLVVVPLRYGAGVKGKTVEAMQHGLPIVTTDIGVEGLPGDFSFLRPANEPAAFAEQIIALYNDEKEMIMMSGKSTRYINENFTEAIAAEIMSRILTTV